VKVLPALLTLFVFFVTSISAADAQVRRAPAGGGGAGRAVPRAVAPAAGHVVVGRPGGGYPGGGYPGGAYPYYRPGGYYYGGHYPYYGSSFSIGLYGGYPFGFGYSVGFSYGYPYGYGYPAYGYPWSTAYYAGYPYGGFGYVAAAPSYSTYGSVRIEGAPPNAQVFADGYYAGVADDKVNLTPGVHRVEIRVVGAPPITFDVQIQPGQTITYRAELPRN